MRRILLLLALTTLAPAQSRTIADFNTNWRFTQSDPANANQESFDDSQWQTVTLPHDWSIALPVAQTNPAGPAGGFYPTGIAWYRNTITLEKIAPTKRTYIAFDGVMANSDVFCNGTLLGHRPYGYVSFHYDLTTCLHPGINSIAVRTHTAQQPASRWYAGSGINRPARLITTNAVHIAPWGTVVTTPTVSAQSATIHVRITVVNQSVEPEYVMFTINLTDPAGHVLKTSFPRALTLLPPNASSDLEDEITIPNPNLWDLDHPALYTVRAIVSKGALAMGGPALILDAESVPFGIREFHFDPNLGFFLNNKPIKIYGAALHTDAGPFGTAVPTAAWARRLTELRKLGVNAIRTAHNPPSPDFLDLCDRMGFLVMDEMFDAWTVAKNPYDYHLYFRDWAVRDTADTIQRDRNHPSIILYSTGNEIHDTPKPDIAIPILKSLVDTIHQYDPTRPVTQALFRPNVSHDYDNGLADLLDVIGQNYREQEILKAHADKPSRKIIGTENTHVREQWVAMRDHPEYSGQFLWTGIDYLGEAGRWPTLGSGSGLLLTTALPRPRAFERQSWWTTTPMVRIARRVQTARRNPTDPGYTPPTPTPSTPTGPTTIPPPEDPTTRFSQPLLADWSPRNQQPHTEIVEVYTNAEEVELFLNNKSLGTQKLHADASPITYQIPFASGTLRAEARTQNKITATDTLRTAGPPARILLEAHTYDEVIASRYLDPSGSSPSAKKYPAPLSARKDQVSSTTKKNPAALASRYPDPSGSSASVEKYPAPLSARKDPVSSTTKKNPATLASRYPDPSGSGSGAKKEKGLQPLGVFLTPDPNDAAFIVATLVDKDGTRIPTNDLEITFTVSAPGQLIATDSGNLQDHTPYASPTRKLYDGNTTAILRTTATHGRITITATTPNLPTATITLPTAPTHPEPQRSF